MLRAIVVDDEPFVRKLILQNLEAYNADLMVVGDCGSVAESEVLIKACKPDVLFLDIQLTDGTGFDLLQKIGDYNFKVLFVTSYEQYAIKAIKCGAFDYILKPLNTDEFDEAVTRLIYEAADTEMVKDRLQLAQESLLGKREHITLRFNESLRIVKFSEIMYCHSDSGYTTFHLKNEEKVLVSRGLKEYEKLMPEDGFMRIHKSYLVNKHAIKEYLKEGYIKLSTGETLPVAVRRKEDIMKFFQ